MFNIIKLNAKDNIAVAPMNIPSGSEINSTLKLKQTFHLDIKLVLKILKKGILFISMVKLLELLLKK